MRRACAGCGKVLPPSDEPPAPGLPADVVSHGMCADCLAEWEASIDNTPAIKVGEVIPYECDADAGAVTGAESASCPGPASHDTMGSRHRRPGESPGRQEGGNLAAGFPPADAQSAARGTTSQSVQVRHSPPESGDPLARREPSLLPAGERSGRQGVSTAERRALLAPGMVDV